jgi:hypothetical protein
VNQYQTIHFIKTPKGKYHCDITSHLSLLTETPFLVVPRPILTFFIIYEEACMHGFHHSIHGLLVKDLS